MWTLLGDIFCFILCKNEKKIYNFRNDEIVCGNVFNYSSGDKYIVMCNESYMPDDMKKMLVSLIEKRVEILAG